MGIAMTMPSDRTRRLSGLVLAVALLAAAEALPAPAEDHAARRREMVAEIRAMPPEDPRDALRTFAPRVLAVLERVPRHEFVPPPQRPHAYENRPLAIGHGQTISQPYIVSLMTDLLRLKPGDRVLEVGTGSGYQAAVLAELVREVYTIEIVEPLARQAKERLARLGYRNVEVRAGDGYQGWEAHAPFDAIMVTAGASQVPPRLLQQLKPGGLRVIPVGEADAVQELTLIEKRADGSTRSRRIVPVRFVPLTGGPGGP